MMRVTRPWSTQARAQLREVLAQPPQERAVVLAESSSPIVRMALAMAPSTSIGVLVHLSQDHHASVRAAVAAHPLVAQSPATVRRLAADDAPDVQAALRANDSVPSGVRNAPSAV